MYEKYTYFEMSIFLLNLLYIFKFSDVLHVKFSKIFQFHFTSQTRDINKTYSFSFTLHTIHNARRSVNKRNSMDGRDINQHST